MSKKSEIKVKFANIRWIIIIMALAIIALISLVFCNKVYCAYKIMEYISYASIILSITLSIFAILYTYTSNVQIQQQFEKINSAAENIHRTNEKLNNTSSKLDENLELILSKLEKSLQNSEKLLNLNQSIKTEHIPNTNVVGLHTDNTTNC